MPVVSSVTTQLKKKITPQIVEASTPEETKQRKENCLDIIDIATDTFKKNLLKGVVPLRTTLDLERIVKLMLLLSGEAESRVGKEPEVIEEDIMEIDAIKKMIDQEDPLLLQLQEKLFEALNDNNDSKDTTLNRKD